MTLTLTGITEQWMALFVLTFARTLGVVFTAPVLSGSNVPFAAKMGLSATVTLLLMPLLRLGAVPAGDILLVGLVKEFIFGAMLGFATLLLFGAIQWAADVIDFQMGFAFMSVVDPASGTHSAITGRFLGLLASLLFLELNGHHLMLRGLAASFHYVPLAGEQMSPRVVALYSQFWCDAVTLAFRVAMPAVVSLMLVDIASGIISRVIPQMNVFLVGMPLKIFVGTWAVCLTLPAFLTIMDSLVSELTRDWGALVAMVR